MKKILLIVVAVFSFAIVEAAEISNTAANYTNSETTANAPVYWSGWVHSDATNHLYIKVYRSENNTCDSFYAVATQHKKTSINNAPTRLFDINETLTVKNGSSSGRYYVTYDGVNYYFSM